jgi:hypothetical protein
MRFSVQDPEVCEKSHIRTRANMRMSCAQEFSREDDLQCKWAIFMSERRIAQLIGLALGGLLTCTMVLNALAY